ncbi:MAG: MFS transporter [Gaiellales bacterium]
MPLCLAVALYKTDATIVNVALPTIQRELHTTPATLLWTVNAYILALTGIIPLAGAIGDRLGRRRVFLAGVIIFTAASAGCALAQTDTQLIVGRVIQGLGAGMLVPLSMSIVGATFRGEDLPTAYGLWSALSSIGFVIGPIVGGILVQQVGWSSVFWVNVPLGILMIPMIFALVRETRDPVPRPLDLVGAALATVGLLLIAWALIGTTEHAWLATPTLAPLIIGIVALIAFVAWERHTPHPLLPLGFFREAGFAIGAIVGTLVYVFPAVILFLALYLQGILGNNPQAAGFLFLPMAGAIMVVGIIAGPLSKRTGPYPAMTAGLLLIALGAIVMLALPVGGDTLRLVIGELAVGSGAMLAIPPASAVMMGAVPRERAGIASAAMQAFRQGGAVLWIAILSAIAAAQTTTAFTNAVPDAHPALPSVIGAELGKVGAIAGARVEAAAGDAWMDGFHAAMLVVALLALFGCALCAGSALRRRHIEHAHPDAHAH